ncbi:ABC transporter permease [Treponema pedis]|uniref:ABC transporter permease n=1 Tax=Treponema pedis TaxID=409322 RepID=UPI000403E48E|nr:ABC transporter permease [Treponema pedis]
MIQSFKYTFKILKNTNGFFASMVVMPVVMIILVSMTLAYSNTPRVGYIGDGGILSGITGISFQRIHEKDTVYFLGSTQGTLVIKINDKGGIEKYYSSIKNNPLISIIESGIGKRADSVFREKPHISYSIGIILFKLLTAASLLAAFLVKEKSNGIFVRLKQAYVSPYAFITGKALAVFSVYEIANGIILVFYRIAGFDFGKTTVLKLFLLFTAALIISIGIYIYIASYIKNEGNLWIFSTGILFPLALCSGTLFPIQYMPQWMKYIAACSPQYYLLLSAVEDNIQIIPLSVMLGVSIILAVTGIRRFMKKE